MLPLVNAVILPIHDHQLILPGMGHRALLRIQTQAADDLHFVRGGYFPLSHGQRRCLRPTRVPMVKNSRATPQTATEEESHRGKSST